jgi:hypothetical protein
MTFYCRWCKNIEQRPEVKNEQARWVYDQNSQKLSIVAPQNIKTTFPK